MKNKIILACLRQTSNFNKNVPRQMKKVLHLVLLVYDTYRIFLPRFWCVYDSIKTKLLKQLQLKTIICVPCFSMIRSLQQNITTHKSWWSLYEGLLELFVPPKELFVNLWNKRSLLVLWELKLLFLQQFLFFLLF